MANRYCPRCLHSFPTNPTECPNLACANARPDGGWGRLLENGDLLDRTYTVRQRLAVGGAGITYQARELDDGDEETGPELAIKVLFASAEGTVLRRLSNEARVLQDLKHPHIVACRGFVHRTGRPAYLVMEFEAGGNLYDHVRHVGALPTTVATSIASQMLEGLSVAHRRKVIHRDLKPQNILLRTQTARAETPHVLLADFGIAKVSGFVGHGLTVAGTFLGTPEFAAPEQFKGLPPTPATDVYAAAACLWYCLTGVPPVVFPNRSDMVDCLRTLRESLPPTLPQHIEKRERLNPVFAAAFALDPEARITVPAFLESLATLDAPMSSEPLFRTPALSEPLVGTPMGTMSPAGLFGEELLDPEIEPEPAPTPAPSAAVAPPPQVEPEPRIATLQDRRPVSTMEAMFEPYIEEEPEPVPELSLDDLFGGSTATPVVLEPDPIEAIATPVASAVVDWEPEDPEPAGAAPSDVLRALGRCPAAERSVLLASIGDADTLVANASTDVASRCGAFLVMKHAGLGRFASRASSALQHSDPDVRATAALALGAVGRPAQLTQLNRLLGDKEPRVRIAVVHALHDLGERTGRTDLVRNWLGSHNDTDERVQSTLARLG